MRRKFSLDAAALVDALSKEDARAVVIGLPVNMDGSEGPRAQASRAFVRNMARLTDLPFVFWDERLSTVAAERALIEMDVSRKKRADADRFGRRRLHPARRARPASGAAVRSGASSALLERSASRSGRAPRPKARAGGGTPRSRRSPTPSKTQARATIGGMVAGSMPRMSP